MLFIDEYKEAYKYHKSLLSCWLKIKLFGKTELKNHCSYCDNGIECSNKNTESHNYKFSNTTLDFFSGSTIEDLLTSKPLKLIELSKKFDSEITDEDERIQIEKLFKESGYSRFFQKKHGKHFLSLLQRSTCTYCNRNYTLNISNRHASAQLDHWYPKDKFAILSLSFYNLIPSCPSCNHIKGNSGKDKIWWQDMAWEEILHPYFPQENEKFKFDFTYNEDKDSFNVVFRDLTGNKIDKSLKFCHIQSIYQSHADLELRDLYYLRLKYPDNYINGLMEKLHLHEPDENEKYRLIFGISKDEKDYYQRPLSKFKNDIIEELLKIE